MEGEAPTLQAWGRLGPVDLLALGPAPFALSSNPELNVY